MIRVIITSLSNTEIENIFKNYNSDGGSSISVDEFIHIFGWNFKCITCIYLKYKKLIL
jgi:hypothetical protein